MTEATAPQSTYTEERHSHTWDHARIVFNRFVEDSKGGLTAEILIETNLSTGASTIFGPSKFNLLAHQTITRTASDLAKRSQVGVDWYEVLRLACELSVERWRDGDPLELVDADADTDRHWLIEPYVEADGATVLFAQGGSGKGYFALSLALSVATGVPILGVEPAIVGPVAYLDWEASKAETDRRITMLSRPLGIKNPPIWYRREQPSLDTTAHSLATQIADRGSVLAIIDSKGMAAKGAAEGSEATINLLRAVRRLRVPCLIIDHISKSNIQGDGPEMAYGSVYTTNGARLAWSMKSEGKPGAVEAVLKNTKANNGPKAKPRKVWFQFGMGQVTVAHSDEVLTVAGGGQSITDRIAGWLEETSVATIDELASGLEVPRDSVRRTLVRYEGSRFDKVGGVGSVWKLSDDSLPDAF